MFTIMHYTPAELLLMVGTAILLAILLAEVFDWTNWFSMSPEPEVGMGSGVHYGARGSKTPEFNPDTTLYGYDDFDGPCTWKERFSEANGSRQSPINITSRNAIVMPSCTTLVWSPEYATLPSEVRMWNDGHSVVINSTWPGARPTISGGPLGSPYELFAIRFRWGPCDDEGSEHTVDYVRFALELQAIHVKLGSLLTTDNTHDIAGKNALAIISYMFQITPVDNPYLEPLVSNLKKVRPAHSKTSVQVFPMCWLMPAFVSNYYVYQGSLSYPPCTEGVKWIIQPEPLAVSSRQVRKFRKLMAPGGELLTNTRPIQKINNRDIYFYDAVEDDCLCTT